MRHRGRMLGRLVAGAVILAATSACSGPARSGAENGHGGPLTADAGSIPAVARSTTLSSVSVLPDLQRPSNPTTTLPCEDAIGGDPPDARTTVVLGVVGLPAAPRYDALGATDSGLADPVSKLFAKTGLAIKSGASFVITVPKDYADRARVGWGNPGQPTTRLTVDACPSLIEGATWLNYAGGYWVAQPMCLPLVVQAGGRQQTVRIGVGISCPGQAAPPTP